MGRATATIYYQARRANALTESERAAIARLRSKYGIEKQLETYLRTGMGLNWESFAVYDTRGGDVIFEGATKLPDSTEDACGKGSSAGANF